MAAALEALNAGDQLLRSFFTEYWGDPEPAQVGRIARVELVDRV